MELEHASDRVAAWGPGPPGAEHGGWPSGCTIPASGAERPNGRRHAPLSAGLTDLTLGSQHCARAAPWAFGGLSLKALVKWHLRS